LSESITKEQEDARPFEERVIAMLLELRLDVQAVDARVQALEAKNFDTKPIWERALAEVVELRVEVRDLAAKTERGYRHLENKLDIFNLDILDLRDRQRRVENRVEQVVGAEE
jgi:hypothetical protein